MDLAQREEVMSKLVSVARGVVLRLVLRTCLSSNEHGIYRRVLYAITLIIRTFWMLLLLKYSLKIYSAVSVISPFIHLFINGYNDDKFIYTKNKYKQMSKSMEHIH